MLLVSWFHQGSVAFLSDLQLNIFYFRINIFVIIVCLLSVTSLSSPFIAIRRICLRYIMWLASIATCIYSKVSAYFAIAMYRVPTYGHYEWMRCKEDEPFVDSPPFLLALLQPGPAGVPQHDALLQALDAGVLRTVLNNLARSAASWKVHTHTNTFLNF